MVLKEILKVLFLHLIIFFYFRPYIEDMSLVLIWHIVLVKVLLISVFKILIKKLKGESIHYENHKKA